ncbi:Receptor-type guanylate cyclase gcy [Seminavis robusta]|uniref:Receptor-type guanylate cyclase gcy n=1 Tax=Seminavis robusta TaxID=568900 RepID=A0A9N8HBW0_9STRA|nr:Receptor-type guanylate cyclase gcy [Seminavis robusta]|eukprot:Sro354_g124710.1 Receptor-type guanylate cyclase gcy (1112) ;mRNA; f:11917-16367
MKMEFSAYSREILKQAQANSKRMFEELWDLSKSITSHALDTNSSWPNCTLPYFDIHAHDLKKKTGNLEFVGFAPFVTPENRAGWEQYSVDNQGWIQQDYNYRNWTHAAAPIPTSIHQYNGSGLTQEDYVFEDPQFDYEIPLWQIAPAQNDTSVINLDLATVPVFAHLLWDIKMKKVEQYSRIMDLHFLLGDNLNQNNPDHPRGTIYQPVMEDFRENADVVGFTMGTLTWDLIFENVLFDSSSPLLVGIEGTCNAIFTYKIGGESMHVQFMGYGEGLRDPQFDKFKQSADLLHPLNNRPGYPPVKHTHRHTDASHGDSHCTYVMNTYPTQEFKDHYTSAEPIYMTILIASIFVFTASVFFLYDYLVQRRQAKLLTTAERTTAIVTSLFPKEVGKRLIEDAKNEHKENEKNKKKQVNFSDAAGGAFDDEDQTENDGTMRGGGIGKPIADIFPSATIMFGDLVGFTAWSSSREPQHVFILLETLYGAFDKIAKRRRVFKIETVGDCYVAVCGLPEERPDHAVAMARFARDCLQKLKDLLISLETHLGPDTTELAMRIGLHSGAVTAGVLRGDRARFQLFGDSVNTCARIETTGQRNRIHVSEQTAKLLIAAGKQRWVVPREDRVEAKGKGTLTTFWLTEGVGSDGMSATCSSNDDSCWLEDDSAAKQNELSARDRRLVDWHVETLSGILRQIQARRNILGSKDKKKKNSGDLRSMEDRFGTGSQMLLDEVEEVIELPVCRNETCQSFLDEAEKCRLDVEVVSELSRFISAIAALYTSQNPFHSWDHASHVTMSVCKLLSRIVSKDDSAPEHDHAFGITSDPLTQFAVVLAAIIHDADHPGVPNSTLISEGSELAALYQNKSIAEQNSVNLVFDLLFESSYSNLRAAIYSDETELKRFRQLLVNSVMATDIMDKELGALRKARWNKAFSNEVSVKEDPNVATNRKATIVIEHLIQASDVAHTMQHWHIYRKWNELLFMEMYKAYKEGRAKDPSESWYQGEMGFFDFYIIPLAKKLKECGVFGVASDEYLDYAMNNRAEWESKGPEQIEMYIQRYNAECAPKEQGQASSSTTTTALPPSFDLSFSSATTVELTEEGGAMSKDFRHYLKRGVRHCDV